MRTIDELREELNRLDQIKNQFPETAAMRQEINTITIAIRYCMNDQKIPTPSEHITRFLQRGHMSAGGLWLPS